jgi:hypothetical protein
MVGGTEKGKIPRGEWPKILARYRGGETIANIGRDYGCTAPAIRYIIKRTGKLRGAAEKNVSEHGAGQTPRAGASTDRGTNLRPIVSAAADSVLGAELRKRVSGDIASFLVALDQTVLEGTTGSAADLQEAADRLMRSIARIRLDLERLLGGGEAPRTRERGSKSPAMGPGPQA